LYEVDVETMLPVKIHTYSLNVNDVEPAWKYDHELTELYQLKDLSPRSFEDLSNRFLESEDLSMLYHNTKSAGGTEARVDSCDMDCRIETYC